MATQYKGLARHGNVVYWDARCVLRASVLKYELIIIIIIIQHLYSAIVSYAGCRGAELTRPSRLKSTWRKREISYVASNVLNIDIFFNFRQKRPQNAHKMLTKRHKMSTKDHKTPQYHLGPNWYGPKLNVFGSFRVLVQKGCAGSGSGPKPAVYPYYHAPC